MIYACTYFLNQQYFNFIHQFKNEAWVKVTKTLHAEQYETSQTTF